VKAHPQKFACSYTYAENSLTWISQSVRLASIAGKTGVHCTVAAFKFA